MYLLHPFIQMEIQIWSPYAHPGLGQHPAAGWAHFGMIYAMTIVLASVSWYVFESPINGLKRYFPYVRPAVVGMQVAAG